MKFGKYTEKVTDRPPGVSAVANVVDDYVYVQDIIPGNEILNATLKRGITNKVRSNG